jgi:hypothetical protein
MEQQALFIWSSMFVIFFFCLFAAILNCCRRQARDMHMSRRSDSAPTEFNDLQNHLRRSQTMGTPDDEILATALALSIMQQRRGQQTAEAIIVQAVPVAISESDDNSNLPVAVPVAATSTTMPTAIAHRVAPGSVVLPLGR